MHALLIKSQGMCAKIVIISKLLNAMAAVFAIKNKHEVIL
jgi:hypothetical protein